MTYLSEDPTFLAGGLLALAGAFMIALRVTQQGKYLIRAGIAAGLAVMVFLVEGMWVTDNERIEQVVYDLRQAVLRSDADGVLKHLAPNVQYLKGETALSGDATRALIKANLSRTSFELVRVSNLRTSVGQQSRRGTAEFQVLTRGSLNQGSMTEAGTALTAWSLGFQEAERGVWKINRITPVSIPGGALAMPDGLPKDDSRLGYNDGISVRQTAAKQSPRGMRRYPPRSRRGEHGSSPHETN